MANWDDLTEEQKLRGLMQAYGLDRPGAEAELAKLDGHAPVDVVGLATPPERTGTADLFAR